MARRRNRMWSAEEKRSICHQTRAPEVSVAQVARRYALNANLIHKWLRDPRYAPEADAEAVAETMPVDAVDGEAAAPSSAVFLPVELVAEARTGPEGPASSGAGTSTPWPGGVIEITLAGGHRLRVEGAYDPDALSRLLRGLAAAGG